MDLQYIVCMDWCLHAWENSGYDVWIHAMPFKSRGLTVSISSGRHNNIIAFISLLPSLINGHNLFLAEALYQLLQMLYCCRPLTKGVISLSLSHSPPSAVTCTTMHFTIWLQPTPYSPCLQEVETCIQNEFNCKNNCMVNFGTPKADL